MGTTGNYMHLLDNYATSKEITGIMIQKDDEYYIRNPDQAICNYIAENPGTTKHKVSMYMTEKHYRSRATTDERIEKLIQEGKIVNRKIGNSFHKLYLNEQNIYNQLVTNINNLSKTVKDWTSLVRSNLELFDSIRGNVHRDVINLIQWTLYTGITRISVEISRNVKIAEDRDKLYLLLNKVLHNSYGVTSTINKWSLDNLHELTRDYKNKHVDNMRELKRDYKNKHLSSKYNYFIKESLNVSLLIKKNSWF